MGFDINSPFLFALVAVILCLVMAQSVFFMYSKRTGNRKEKINGSNKNKYSIYNSSSFFNTNWSSCTF